MSEQRFRDELDLLRERDLGRLFVARFVAAFGSAMAPVAMAFGALGWPSRQVPDPEEVVWSRRADSKR